MAVSKLQGVRHMAAAVVVGLMLLIALIVTKTQSENDSGGMGVSVLEQAAAVGKNSRAGSVDQELLNKLSARLETGKGTGKSKNSKGVQQAALDIAQVISEGEQDEKRVKQVVTRSRTHHGSKSAALALEQDLKLLHAQANAKKSAHKRKAAVSGEKSEKGETGDAIDKALDLSHAGAQVKMAKEEALAIEKVLDQSKEDVAAADVIEKHSEKGNGSKIWSSLWDSKRSLVARLAQEVGVSKKAATHHSR